MSRLLERLSSGFSYEYSSLIASYVCTVPIGHSFSYFEANECRELEANRAPDAGFITPRLNFRALKYWQLSIITALTHGPYAYSPPARSTT